MSSLSLREGSRPEGSGFRHRSLWWRRGSVAGAGALLALVGTLVADGTGSAAAVVPASHRSSQIAKAPSPGQWTALATLAGAQTQGGVPALWVNSKFEGFVVWPISYSTGSLRSSYEAATIAANGSVGKPVSVFGSTRWSSLGSAETLVGSGSGPLLVFQGARSTSSSDPYSHGCVVGAAGTGTTWTLQSWALSGTSNSCNGVSGSAVAAEGHAGVLSAAWTNGSAVYYRIGTSPTIPATGSDSSIALKTWYPYYMGEASDASSGHFYVAWTVGGDSGDLPVNGFFVKDVSGGGSVEKAPGSGINSISPSINQGGRVAIAGTNTHGGVFMAYCSNATHCTVDLWKVGATKSVAVPGSLNGVLPEIAAGPDGRLWIAWINPQDQRVFVVRTNKADTRFGPVERYKVPFPYSYNALGLGGGSFGRLDVALDCSNNKAENQIFTTQVLAPLSLKVATPVIVDTSPHTVVFEVTDAGDPVAGAHVAVDGKSATTNSSGIAKIAFPAGAKTGTYGVTASAPDYLRAQGLLTIKS